MLPYSKPINYTVCILFAFKNAIFFQYYIYTLLYDIRERITTLQTFRRSFFFLCEWNSKYIIGKLNRFSSLYRSTERYLKYLVYFISIMLPKESNMCEWYECECVFGKRILIIKYNVFIPHTVSVWHIFQCDGDH